MQDYNLIWDIKDMEHGSPSNSEPVSLSEMKDYLRLESFEDNQGSTSDVSFDSDDELIQELITAAREGLEKYTGLAFIPKELRVTLTNLAGMIELPYGPIGDVTALYFDGDDDLSDNEIDSLVLKGFDFKRIESPCDCKMVVDYSCGYGRGDTQALPKALKKAIMTQVTYSYEHRGEELEDEGLCKHAKRLADPFRRTTWLA